MQETSETAIAARDPCP